MATGSRIIASKLEYSDYEVALLERRCDHTLKIYPQYFNLQLDGLKPYEVRINDRGFKAGDLIMLKEVEMQYLTFTGRFCVVIVDHVLDDCPGLQESYCIMSTTLKLYGKLEGCDND